MEPRINPIGCHGLVWTSDFRPDRFDDVARRIAAAGFDLFEVPLMDPWGFDAERAAATLRAHNLQATLSVGHGADTDVSSEARQPPLLEKNCSSRPSTKPPGWVPHRSWACCTAN